ncbi:centrosome-associated protein CEP250-like, partial [Cetorhinus maximus]
VVQYKKRCGELEQQLITKEAAYREMELSESVRFREYEEEQVRSLENTLIRLEEEQQRCSSLAEVNTLLREQLNEANAANRALSEDLHKLTEDWTLAREELEVKESDWRHEEETYNTYLSGEHDRFLSLWKRAVNLRRQFVQMKTATDRDLSEGRANMARLASTLQAACLGLGGSLRVAEAGNSLSRAREQARVESLDKEVRERTQEIFQLQVRFQAERAELNAR